MNKLELKKNISLSNFTTWRIGGPAEWIAQPKNNDEIKYLINWINKKKNHLQYYWCWLESVNQ